MRISGEKILERESRLHYYNIIRIMGGPRQIDPIYIQLVLPDSASSFFLIPSAELSSS